MFEDIKESLLIMSGQMQNGSRERKIMFLNSQMEISELRGIMYLKN